MAQTTAPTTDAATGADEAARQEATTTPVIEERPAARLVEADLLVEDVSIDGMCGVY